MNVIDTGHLVEQTTKFTTFRPELAVFTGYTFVRTSSGVIEVWRSRPCEACSTLTRSESHFVRVGNATDAIILRHGLIQGEKSPVRGFKTHTSAPFLCEPCNQKWLKGDALETLSTPRDIKIWS